MSVRQAFLPRTRSLMAVRPRRARRRLNCLHLHHLARGSRWAASRCPLRSSVRVQRVWAQSDLCTPRRRPCAICARVVLHPPSTGVRTRQIRSPATAPILEASMAPEAHLRARRSTRARRLLLVLACIDQVGVWPLTIAHQIQARRPHQTDRRSLMESRPLLHAPRRTLALLPRPALRRHRGKTHLRSALVWALTRLSGKMRRPRPTLLRRQMAEALHAKLVDSRQARRKIRTSRAVGWRN